MEHFLPTITLSKPSPQKNLTGYPRILKDSAADIHANIQRWNSIHLHGLSILKSITTIKVNDSYPNGLQELCDELEKDIDQLDGVVNNLKIIVCQIKATILLHSGKGKLFTTWSPGRFTETTEQLYEAYKDEVKIKREIFENVAHDFRDSRKMLHLATWVHQPMIPHKLDAILESLLIETGHR